MRCFPAEVFGDANWLRGGDPAYKVNIISACADRVVFESSGHACAYGSDVPGISRADRYTPGCRVHGPARTALRTAILGLAQIAEHPGSAVRFDLYRRVCLGKAGLLDGRRATTHWNWASELAQDHPRVVVDPNPIYVRDGSCYTSADLTNLIQSH